LITSSLILLAGAFGTVQAEQESPVAYAGCVEISAPLDRLSCFVALQSTDDAFLGCGDRTSPLEKLNCFDRVALGLDPPPEAPKPPPTPPAVQAKRGTGHVVCYQFAQTSAGAENAIQPLLDRGRYNVVLHSINVGGLPSGLACGW
jgi:hypothetical protein